jgi:hypothetical protein
MRKNFLVLLTLLLAVQLQAQVQPGAGNWKTWFITSGKDWRLPAPSSYKEEISLVMAQQQNIDADMQQQIIYWNAGAPGYRWQNMVNSLWLTDTGYTGALANMLLNVAIYDATVAAWDTKYTYKRPRPFDADKRIRIYTIKPESPSYPCEYSVAAGVATTIIAHFFPSLADSVNRMAKQLMASRIAAGVAFPGDTRAGFDLGRKIAEKEIELTKNYTPQTAWDRKMPDQPGVWKGKNPMFPLAGRNKTVVLDSSSQFRPAPPPDFAKDMAELKSFKQTFRSRSNAFYWANESFWDEVLNKKIFERNYHLDPPRVARIYAIKAIAMYDGFAACWDAKYAYWGIRPDQYDTTYRPLMPTPPFPGYPSGHAAISGEMGELYSYFFPEDKAYFQRKAKDAAESRFQGGIHFRADNEAGLELGRKIAAVIVERAKRMELE